MALPKATFAPSSAYSAAVCQANICNRYLSHYQMAIEQVDNDIETKLTAHVTMAKQ